MLSFQRFRYGPDDGNVLIGQAGNIDYIVPGYIQQIIRGGVEDSCDSYEHIIGRIPVPGLIIGNNGLGNADSVRQLLLGQLLADSQLSELFTEVHLIRPPFPLFVIFYPLKVDFRITNEYN